jgi:hypothetical protein
MKGLTWFLLALLTALPVYAKPKVEVGVKVNEGISKDQIGDKLSNGKSSPGQMFSTTVWYLNVTVLSNNTEAVAKNNGQWCITGDTGLDVNATYQGTLDGNYLEIQVTGKNGKTKKLEFEVIDHKWRKLSEID